MNLKQWKNLANDQEIIPTLIWEIFWIFCGLFFCFYCFFSFIKPTYAVTWDMTERPYLYDCTTSGNIIYNGELTTNPANTNGDEYCYSQTKYNITQPYYIKVYTQESDPLPADIQYIFFRDDSNISQFGLSFYDGALRYYYRNNSNEQQMVTWIEASAITGMQYLKISNDYTNSKFIMEAYGRFNGEWSSITNYVNYSDIYGENQDLRLFYRLARNSDIYNRIYYSEIDDTLIEPTIEHFNLLSTETYTNQNIKFSGYLENPTFTPTSAALINGLFYGYEKKDLTVIHDSDVGGDPSFYSATDHPENVTTVEDLDFSYVWTSPQTNITPTLYFYSADYTPATAEEGINYEEIPLSPSINITNYVYTADSPYEFYAEPESETTPLIYSGATVNYTYSFSGATCTNKNIRFLPKTDETEDIDLGNNLTGNFSHTWTKNQIDDWAAWGNYTAPRLILQCDDEQYIRFLRNCRGAEYTYCWEPHPLTLNYATTKYYSSTGATLEEYTTPNSPTQLTYQGESQYSDITIGGSGSVAFGVDNFYPLQDEKITFHLYWNSDNWNITGYVFYPDFADKNTFYYLNDLSTITNQNQYLAWAYRDLGYKAPVIHLLGIDKYLWLGGNLKDNDVWTEDHHVIEVVTKEYQDYLSGSGSITMNDKLGLFYYIDEDWTYPPGTSKTTQLLLTGIQNIVRLTLYIPRYCFNLFLSQFIDFLQNIIAPIPGLPITLPNEFLGFQINQQMLNDNNDYFIEYQSQISNENMYFIEKIGFFIITLFLLKILYKLFIQ